MANHLVVQKKTPRASAVGGSFAPHGGLIAPHVSFCLPIRPLSQRKYWVVLNKRGDGP